MNIKEKLDYFDLKENYTEKDLSKKVRRIKCKLSIIKNENNKKRYLRIPKQNPRNSK